ncbi:MAG TPA: hypothetical protein VHA52_02295 [Candidatus Babeliaceae bacterium]|nr:hypothetical protein [Candidatus Babeliaceae bacterium]
MAFNPLNLISPLLTQSGREFLFGQPKRIEQINRFNPQQQNALQEVLHQGLSGLKNPSQGFEPIKNEALSTFHQNIVPLLYNQLNAQNGQNAISSPQLHTNLSSAGSSLAQKLAAMQSGYEQNNKQNALNQLGIGLTEQNINYPVEGSSGLLGNLIEYLPLLLSAYVGTPLPITPSRNRSSGFDFSNINQGIAQNRSRLENLFPNVYQQGMRGI